MRYGKINYDFFGVDYRAGFIVGYKCRFDISNLPLFLLGVLLTDSNRRMAYFASC